MTTYLTFGLMVLLFFMRVPIWAAIFFSCIPYLIINNVPISAIPSIMTTGQITSFILLSFPLFTLAGRLMNIGDITNRIFDFAEVSVGWIRGGLGHSNVLASMLFAGMSGSAVADISGLGAVEMKGMTEKGYDPDFSIGVTLASSVIGPIIPPSMPIIFYAVIAEESVAKLFLGGVIPGALIGISLMIMIFFTARKRDYFVRKKPGMREYLQSCKAVFLPLMTPVIIVAGMSTGVFTPTEAASIAVIYALILGVFVYRKVGLSLLWHEFKETVLFAGSIYLIVAASMVMSFIITRERIADTLVSTIIASSMDPVFVIFTLVFITLIMGCFIDVTAMIILVLPVMIPIVTAIGFSKIAFGVIFILAAVMGVATPPFGLGLYIGSEISRLDFNTTVRSVLPYGIPLGVVIILMVLWPRIVTFLPDMLM